MFFTIGDLILYIADPSHINTPTAKKIAWSQSGYGKIQALTFGLLGDKLAVVCSRFLYILPFGTFMVSNVMSCVSEKVFLL